MKMDQNTDGHQRSISVIFVRNMLIINELDINLGSSGVNPVKVRVLSRAPCLFSRAHQYLVGEIDSPHCLMDEGIAL